MNIRIALLFGLLAFSYAMITWIGSGADAVVSHKVDLSVISTTLNEWEGEDIDIPDDTVQVMKADQYINRTYRDASGRTMFMHVANWSNKETISPAPHHPEICYPSAGWKIEDRRTTQITTAAGDIPIELILFQKDQTRVVTGHWFQVADVCFVSSDGFQRHRHRFWGKNAWPSTTKILLSIAANSVGAAENRLKDFATLIANELSKEFANEKG
jgi:EpsI family protein